MFEHVKHPNVLNRNTAWDISLSFEYLLQSFSPLKNTQTQCLRHTKPLPAHIYPSMSSGLSSPGLQSCFSNHSAIKQEFVPVWRHRLGLSWAPFLETINQICLYASLASLSTTTIIIIIFTFIIIAKKVSFVSD